MEPRLQHRPDHRGLLAAQRRPLYLVRRRRGDDPALGHVAAPLLPARGPRPAQTLPALGEDGERPQRPRRDTEAERRRGLNRTGRRGQKERQREAEDLADCTVRCIARGRTICYVLRISSVSLVVVLISPLPSVSLRVPPCPSVSLCVPPWPLW